MNTVYIVDSFCFNKLHEMFNAGLLSVCTYLTDKIQYYASKSNIKCIDKILYNKPVMVNFHYIPVIESNNKYLVILRYMLSCIINWYFLVKMEKSDILIYNNNNIFSSRMVNILNKYFKKKVLIFCHGEMEVLNQELCLGRLSEIIKKNVLKLFLDKRQKIAENLFFIVLGEHIQTNLRKIIPKHIFDHILSMEHPYIFSHKNGAKPRGKTISFGTVGTVIKNKNIEQFLILVNSFQNEVEKGDISFTIVGPVHYKKEEILSAKINILTESGLSRERFNKELDKLDYVLYFYNSNMYRFTASGVIFDSINMEKPILALKTRYFEYLFSVYGSFGLLLDSTKDMIDSIYRLINGSLLNDIFFDDIKQKLSIENIAGQFKETLKKIEYYRDIWW